MTATAIRPDIEKFAQEVRLALKDLGPHEVRELTEGLEADLAAQADEQGSVFELPEASAYAAELRDAAGLPLNAKGLFGRYDRLVELLRRRVARSQTFGAVSNFLVMMAPIWWVGRAYVAFALFELAVMRTPYAFVPRSVLEWTALIAFIVISTQLGRGRWSLNPGAKRVVGALNLFALLVAPFTLGQMTSVASDAIFLYENGAQIPTVQEGLRLNSQQVDNIFAYDENGEPLTNVRLFTQSGEPLSVKFNGGDFPQVVFEDSFPDAQYVENQRAGRGNGWNVFPLQMVSNVNGNMIEEGRDLTDVLMDSPLPFPAVPELRKTTSH